MKRWVGGILALLVLAIGGLWMWNPMDPLWRVMAADDYNNTIDMFEFSSDVTDHLAAVRPLIDMQLFVYGWTRSKSEPAIRPDPPMDGSTYALFKKVWPQLGIYNSTGSGCATTAYLEVVFESDWKLASARIWEEFTICY